MQMHIRVFGNFTATDTAGPPGLEEPLQCAGVTMCMLWASF